uniref:Uncharacterized protein n=1 Tax=Globisporangium ultimum (strain ATCC 200006 / CBS 805.95 / DAOM BR144) TaxID=431595 RepID=K3WJ18_GLOUD
MPTNAFVMSIKERMRQNGSLNDLWSEGYTKNPFQTPPAPSVPRSSGKDIDVSFGNDKQGARSYQQQRENDGNNEPENIEFEDTSGRNSFFFGSQRSSSEFDHTSERNLPPLSRDPYAHYQTNPGRHRGNSNDAPLDDEDEYFFDAPPSHDAPPKPTSWEEIRRRAAQQQRK